MRYRIGELLLRWAMRLRAKEWPREECRHPHLKLQQVGNVRWHCCMNPKCGAKLKAREWYGAVRVRMGP